MTCNLYAPYVTGGPKNLYYAPVQQTYEIGTEIQCFADSNPPSNFFWQNLNTNERWDDYRLYTYDNMVGGQIVWCHAQNIIGNNVYSDDLFFNLTVNREKLFGTIIVIIISVLFSSILQIIQVENSKRAIISRCSLFKLYSSFEI